MISEKANQYQSLELLHSQEEELLNSTPTVLIVRCPYCNTVHEAGISIKNHLSRWCKTRQELHNTQKVSEETLTVQKGGILLFIKRTFKRG